MKIYWAGIPVGPELQDFLIAGNQERCEAVRANMRASTLWSKEREVPPTDPCKGPFYFKRESPTSAVTP